MPEDNDKLGFWKEWKEKCAAGLCCEEAQGYFQHFGQRALALALWRRDLGGEDVPTRSLRGDLKQGWHEFEYFMLAGKKKSGKRYKDWFFLRVATSMNPPSATCEMLARSCFNTAISRNLLKEEGTLKARVRGSRTVSINEPVTTTSPDSPTLEELIPGNDQPAANAEAMDLNEIAAEEAQALFDAMPQGEKVVYVAKYVLTIALNDKSLTTPCGMGRDARYKVVKTDVPDRIRKHISATFTTEDTRTMDLLFRLIHNTALPKIAAAWNDQEKPLSGCLTKV